MHKKATVFLWGSVFICLLALYTQITLMNNDVSIYSSNWEEGSKTSSTNDSIKKHKTIHMDVKKKTTIYISYKGEVQGNPHTFKIIDTNNNVLIDKTGKIIDIYKEKVTLEKGPYKIIINIHNAKHINLGYNIIHRKQDVIFN